MFILPYLYTPSPHPLLSCRILVWNGVDLWEEEDSLRIIEDVLAPNGIYVKRPPFLSNGIYYCEVDPLQTDIDDFYQWEELPLHGDPSLSWRRFYRVGDTMRIGSYPLSALLGPIVEQSKPLSP